MRVKKISQKEFAAHLGISQPYLSQLISGDKEAKFPLMEKAAKYFDMTAKDFLDEDFERIYLERITEQKKEPERIGLEPTLQQLLDIVKQLSVQDQERFVKMAEAFAAWGRIGEHTAGGTLKKDSQ